MDLDDNVLEQEVEFGDDFEDTDQATHDETIETETHTTPTNGNGGIDEALVQEKAISMANNYLYQMALEDPELAALLQRRAGKQQTTETAKEQSMDKGTKQSSTKSQTNPELESLKEEIQRMKEKEKSREMEQWERTAEKVDQFFEDNPVAASLPNELQEKLKNTALQNYWVANSHQKTSINSFLKGFKRDLVEMKKHFNKQLLEEKKKQRVPSTPPRDKILEGLGDDYKDKRFKGEDLQNGTLKKIAMQMLRNRNR